MVLIVNGQKIEDWQLHQEIERLRPDYEKAFRDMGPDEREAQLVEWSRENLIERVLINQQARKRNEKIPQEKIESALTEIKKKYADGKGPGGTFDAKDEEKVRGEIELQIRVERLLQDTCKDISEPSDEDILRFYQENKEEFRTAEQIRAAHIVKHINWQTDEAAAYEQIKKARDRLKNGAVFETLAAECSDCPENGGDLGYIKRGQMVEEFEDVVFNLGIGEVSDVFHSRFGFHIAKLYDRRPAVLHSLEEVKEHIADALKEQMRNKVIEDFIDRLKSGAEIEQA